jgi:hypothetical protein
MHNINKSRDRDVIPFFMRRSIYLTFFDRLSLAESSIVTSAHLRAAEGPRQEKNHQWRSVQSIDREEKDLENTHHEESDQEKRIQESRSLLNNEILMQNHPLNQKSHYEENIQRLKTYNDRSERDIWDPVDYRVKLYSSSLLASLTIYLLLLLILGFFSLLLLISLRNERWINNWKRDKFYLEYIVPRQKFARFVCFASKSNTFKFLFQELLVIAFFQINNLIAFH